MKKSSKIILSLFMVFSLMISLIITNITNVFATGGYVINFEGKGTHTMQIDGGLLKIDNVIVELKNGDTSIGEAACTDSTHCSITVDSDTAGELRYNAGGAFTLYNTNGHTPYSFGTSYSSNQVFFAEDEEQNQNNNNNNNGGNTSGTVHYTYTGARADVTVNGGYLDPEQAAGIGDENGGELEGEVSYDWESGQVEISVDIIFLDRLTSLSINGQEFNTDPTFPNTPAELLTAFRNQMFHYVFSVDKADTYNIVTTSASNIEDNEYMVIGNFLWSYMDKDKGTDDYVGHGTFELVNAKYNNVDYSEQDIYDQDLGYIYWEQDENEGGAVFPVGTELTVRLIPEAGYQLTSFTINGGEFDAGDEVGTYTFTVPKGNFHLGAHFTKVANEVDSEESEIVSSGSIKLGGEEESMSNGTAKLDVKDLNGDLTDEEKKEFAEAAGSYNVKNYLDISLFNTIYKGSADDSWDTQVDELNHKATITLKLAADVDGNEVVIVHQKHDGTYEVIETTYDPVTHTVTFTTDSFSNYAIASKTVDKTNPKTGDNISLYLLMLVGGIFGLVLINKTKENC